ncbi:hypothetical protein BSL78_09037 [Apostichopus japonicus]|uniref:Netrin receptor UNC5 n=1 Tax=Stichopus japonicus TaxID=307972 RepID=A0A2G8L1C4_STIJA|nr:hypothetical protein BSL78_09037 [Apostichopus japonicus]
MENEEAITTEGGFIEIEGTGVSLIIPPGAFEEEQLIKMRIVLDDYQDELSRSFGSNSSVVVELLPSNLKLQKQAKLTLPHCLVLEKGCEWKAEIYTSHHEEGNQPFWEEDPFASSELHEKDCVIWLQHFSWEIQFGIKKAVDLKNEDILRKQHVVFNNKEELPLTILFKDLPSIWTCSPEEENPKKISFGIVAEWKGCYSTFVLKVQENSEIKGYSCYFKAGQGTNLVDLKFPLEIWRPPISKFASGVKTADIKQPPAAEETMETSSSAEATKIPSNLCSTHLSISRGELTSGPPLDFPATSTCYKCIALLKYVAQHIVETWKDVGRNLKLAESCIQRIKIDHQLCSEQSFQMLMKWIDEYGSGANFMVLGKALEEDKNLLLKQQLEQRIKDEHI